MCNLEKKLNFWIGRTLSANMYVLITPDINLIENIWAHTNDTLL